MDTNYKSYKRYDDEFKRNAVELLESSGRSISEVSGDLGIPYKTLERWRGLYRRGMIKSAGGSGQVPEAPNLADFKELRRKLANAETDREILKKALAICSRDPDLKRGSS